MKKFLALCEEFDPVNAFDPKFELLEFLKSKGIHASAVKGTDTIYIDTGGPQNIVVTVSVPEEDAETTDMESTNNVSNEVEGLAGKKDSLQGVAKQVFGNTAQKAAGAIQQRSGVAQQAVGAYSNKTNQLRKDIANVR